MKKLRLDLGAIDVESFAACGALAADRGTVEAQVTSVNGTCNVSCFYTACQAAGTCGPTCGDC